MNLQVNTVPPWHAGPLILLFCSLLFVSPQPAAGRFTPLHWQQLVPTGPMTGQLKHLDWSADRNGNFVDDQIDALADTERVAITINMNQCRPVKEIESAFAPYGNLTYQGKFITVVGLRDVLVSDVAQIAAREDVAGVQLQGEVLPTIGHSVRAIKVLPSASYPDSLQGEGLTGNGVNIAILDSGVDNGHIFFSGNRFRFGYDAVTRQETDPDDADAEGSRHGTPVAGIALGSAPGYPACGNDETPDRACIGVAPGAGLVDIKVWGPGQRSLQDDAMAALDQVIAKREEWNIGVANMSFAIGLSDGETGQDAFSALVNFAVEQGIVMVAAAGNDGRDGLLYTPATASGAITVASANDQDSVARDDDSISVDQADPGSTLNSSIGPRASDGDGDPYDELKPEVTAPGVNVLTSLADAADGSSNAVGYQLGTSMAAPHVAGLAALLLEAQPGLSPLTLKERLIRTAESSLELAGMEYSNVVDDYPTRVDFPNLDPRYDVGSGFGLVDAVEAAGLESPTDVRFPPRGSTEPSWVTTNIQLASEPAVDGVANTIRVTVENAGDALATGVRVSVGTQVFGTGINHFEQVGVQVVDIPAGTEIVLDFPWLPRSGHRCAIATIDYALDSDLSNNRAQRNLYVVSTASPAEFAFDVGNPLVVPAFIQLEAHSDNPNWLCELDTASVALDPFTDCPVRVSGRIEPNLPGNSDPPDADGRALIGGVSIRGVDDTFGEATCHVYAFTVRCDVDIDGDVDRDDVAEIFDRRNTAASFGDPRDPNGDGIIDVNDARRCVVRCTNPRCAP